MSFVSFFISSSPALLWDEKTVRVPWIGVWMTMMMVIGDVLL